MAEALYRKYRPQVFEDVVGQEPIERTLKNAISQDKVSHAYLFCGPRGTGKTTTARLLAKALLCEKGPTPDPDGTCEECQLIAEGTHPDVYELDAASRTGVENVREEIIGRVQFAPTRGRSKVYIIDEVHMLSTAAFNALLKTLEEPPSHVVFILCTTDPQKVPETIHSRCQRFDFRRIAPESMVSRLGAICMAENVQFEGEALDLIAHRAEGGLRNALTSLEQIIAFENGKVTLAGAERLLGSIDSNDMAEIMSYVGKRDIANCFRWTAAYVETGADLAQFVRDMAEHVRNLYVMALAGDDVDLEIGETARRELAGELQWFGPDRASRLLGVLGDLSSELKTATNPRLAFEIALTRMVRPDSDLTLEGLAERIEALEGGYSAVAHVLPGQPVAHSPQPSAPAPFEAARQHVQPAQQQAQPAQPAAEPLPAASAAAAEPVQQAVRQPASEPVQAAQPDQGAQPAAAVAQEHPVAGRSPAPAASGDDLAATLGNPAALQRVWQAALSAVKKQKQAYAVLFMNVKVRYEGGMLKVVFPAESSFAFNAVQKPEVAEALTAALAKAVGAEVPFAYEQGGQAAAQKEPAAQAQVATPPMQQAAPTAEPVAQPAPAEEAPAQAAPAAQPQEPADYDQVPYEDAPYEPVPYEEFDPGFSAPSQDGAEQPMPAGSAQAHVEPAADNATGASPADANLTPTGALADDPSDLQAMLQEGFGGGVVFSQVEE